MHRLCVRGGLPLRGLKPSARAPDSAGDQALDREGKAEDQGERGGDGRRRPTRCPASRTPPRNTSCPTSTPRLNPARVESRVEASRGRVPRPEVARVRRDLRRLWRAQSLAACFDVPVGRRTTTDQVGAVCPGSNPAVHKPWLNIANCSPPISSISQRSVRPPWQTCPALALASICPPQVRTKAAPAHLLASDASAACDRHSKFGTGPYVRSARHKARHNNRLGPIDIQGFTDRRMRDS